MEMNPSPNFFDWYNGIATDEEKKLFEKMQGFEEYFRDMLFENGSASYELIKCQAYLKERDMWIDDTIYIPEELEYFSYTMFRVKIEERDDFVAAYNHLTQCITVTPEYVDKDDTVLHEMIHLHEAVINELPMYYRDALFWSLYKDLSAKVDGLDVAITQHVQGLNQEIIARMGGTHSILFFLKSIDLDIRMGLPFGTIMAYDGVKDFSFLSLKKSDTLEHQT